MATRNVVILFHISLSLMTFRIQAKSFLLTYPKCNLNCEQIKDGLLALELDIEAIHIGREHHEDGDLHIHVYLRLSKRLTTRNCNYFDIGGHHCNISAGIRNHRQAWEYVGKEGFETLTYPEGATYTVEKENKWMAVIEAATPDDFDTAAIEASARDYVINFERIETYKRHKFSHKHDVYIPKFTEFDLTQNPDLELFKNQMNEVSAPAAFPPPAPHYWGVLLSIVINPSEVRQT